MTNNGGNDRQWGMTDTGEWQTIGNGVQWEMTDNGWWKTMVNERQ